MHDKREEKGSWRLQATSHPLFVTHGCITCWIILVAYATTPRRGILQGFDTAEGFEIMALQSFGMRTRVPPAKQNVWILHVHLNRGNTNAVVGHGRNSQSTWTFAMVTLTSKQVEYVHVCNFEIDLFKLVLILKKNGRSTKETRLAQQALLEQSRTLIHWWISHAQSVRHP